MMIRLQHILCTVLCISLPLSLSFASSKELSVGARFSGTLIERPVPCSLHPGDENIVLPLSGFNLNTLKTSQESIRFPFSIRLENCSFNLQEPAYISVYLTGQGDSNGMLQLSSGSTARGVVIGIEDEQGKALPLNTSSAVLTQPLNAAEIVIRMQAYLKVADAAALAAGEYDATMNYVIGYP